MEIIKFSYNWNKKLNCDCFTTLRLPSSKFQLHKEFMIELNGVALKTAKIVALKHSNTDTFTDEMCYLDTGYNAEETRNIITKMYKKLPDVMTLITLKTVRVIPGAFNELLLKQSEKLMKEIEHYKNNSIN